MKRLILTALAVDLIVTLALVLGFFLWPSGDRRCYQGYLIRGWYTHSIRFQDHDQVSGAQRVWLCSTGEFEYFGIVVLPEGATVINARP